MSFLAGTLIPTKSIVSQVQELSHSKTYITIEEHQDGPFNRPFKYGRDRMLTLFMYLSDVEEGGETSFPRVKIVLSFPLTQ